MHLKHQNMHLNSKLYVHIQTKQHATSIKNLFVGKFLKQMFGSVQKRFLIRF